MIRPKNIVVASNNANKIAEIRFVLYKIFPDIILLSLKDIGYDMEIVEDAQTFEQNALIKSRAVASCGFCAIGDDSGLCVDALFGAPGVFSARFSGDGATDKKNNEKLLDLLRDIPEGKRTARFTTVISYSSPDGTEFTVESSCEGVILNSQCGSGGFGYDPLFYYQPLGKSFAQMTMQEKNDVSHRAGAISLFSKKLQSLYG